MHMHNSIILAVKTPSSINSIILREIGLIMLINNCICHTLFTMQRKANENGGLNNDTAGKTTAEEIVMQKETGGMVISWL